MWRRVRVLYTLVCYDMVFYVACLAQAWATCAYSMGTYARDRVMRVCARETRRVTSDEDRSSDRPRALATSLHASSR